MDLDTRAMRYVREMDASCGVPMCIYWNTQKMAEWIEEIGYPQYRPCFERNNLTGRYLIKMDASTLPDLGIHDFDHIKDITKHIRELLGIKKLYRNMDAALRDPIITYIDQKSRSGNTTAHTIYPAFIRKYGRWFR